VSNSDMWLMKGRYSEEFATFWATDRQQEISLTILSQGPAHKVQALSD